MKEEIKSMMKDSIINDLKTKNERLFLRKHAVVYTEII